MEVDPSPVTPIARIGPCSCMTRGSPTADFGALFDDVSVQIEPRALDRRIFDAQEVTTMPWLSCFD